MSEKTITPILDVPHDFVEALESLKGHYFRPEIHVSQIPPPKKIAPWTVALMAEVNTSNTLDETGYRGEARFVLLYDPNGQSSWNGTFRIVIYAKAPVESIMADDPLLGEVAWAWLAEALEERKANYHSLTGTVTRVYNEAFSDIMLQNTDTDIELRASWTPTSADCSAHIQAWADFASSICGLDPEGISSLQR